MVMDEPSVVLKTPSIAIGLLSDTMALDWLLLANTTYGGHAVCILGNALFQNQDLTDCDFLSEGGIAGTKITKKNRRFVLGYGLNEVP